jgi:DNA topoisomerase VI subunit A
VQLCSPSFAIMQDTDPYAWLQYVSVTWTSGLGLSMATGKASS